MWKKTQVMRITRQPSPVQTGKKQLENVKYSVYLGSIITSDARCTREIKSRIVMAKAAFNEKEIFSLDNGTRLQSGSVWRRHLDRSKIDQTHLQSFGMWCWRRMAEIR
jgi:hypothetical protein